jgi:anti-sigma-K factor RskA
MAHDHSEYDDNVGAYLLDALDQGEREAFERHLTTCSACRHEVERLRPAADALPRSAPPVAPPATLKASLMEVVDEEARRERGETASALRPAPARLVRALGRIRPAAAWVSAAFLLAAGVVTGYALARVLSGDEARTVAASVDQKRVPYGSGLLVVRADREGAILHLHGMPTLQSNFVYQVWLQRDREVVSESIFNVEEDGDGAAAVPDDLEGADAVLVTREPSGGARAPSGPPLVRVKL